VLTEIGDVCAEANFCSVNSVYKTNTEDQKKLFALFSLVSVKLGFIAWLR
jgi:hypothetical protein